VSNIVLITGSTSGIGLATARRFAERGDVVIFNSAHSVEAGEHLASITYESIYVQADIAYAADCERLIATVLEKYGRIDILVNNAGTTKVIPHRDIDAASVDIWREIFDVNVFGTWQLSVAAMPTLREHRGSIVNVSSAAGLRPTGSSIPYAASKAALNHMTALLAKAVGPEVRVNAVAPGLIDTPWTQDWGTVRSYVEGLAPLRRSGTPDDRSGARGRRGTHDRDLTRSWDHESHGRAHRRRRGSNNEAVAERSMPHAELLLRVAREQGPRGEHHQPVHGALSAALHQPVGNEVASFFTVGAQAKLASKRQQCRLQLAHGPRRMRNAQRFSEGRHLRDVAIGFIVAESAGSKTAECVEEHVDLGAVDPEQEVRVVCVVGSSVVGDAVDELMDREHAIDGGLGGVA
jgi:ketoreductase RED2